MSKELTTGRSDEAGALTARLSSFVRAFEGRRVAVVGDLVADQFLYGEISRVSREAPVFILRHEHTDTVPGGAANCAANLAALGARASIVGTVGRDETGRALLERLRAAGVETSGVLELDGARTTTKVRILAGQAHSTRQQVIRVDYEGAPLAPQAPLHEELAARLRDSSRDADACVISDYNYGVAGPRECEVIREAVAARGAHALVDSRFRLTEFGGFTSATPNEDEVEQLVGRRLGDRAALEQAGRELRERLNFPSLLVTRGPEGMLLLQANAEPLHLRAVGAREAVDVTGAGDTVIAAYALALASGASFADAARLANHAGGLVVMKRGTASVTPRELLASLEDGES
ncbi:MAG TPA: PfkB family carbohydrate kinase [Pyrinomonadaceae bacterium]|nr:PfkB family carbohydrate kinase [Pyrinomonadaceae bacterium]